MVGNNFPKLRLIVPTLRAHRYTQLSPRLVYRQGCRYLAPWTVIFEPRILLSGCLRSFTSLWLDSPRALTGPSSLPEWRCSVDTCV